MQVPRAGTPLVSDKLLGDLRATGWFPLSCTIQHLPSPTVEDSFGAPEVTDDQWTDLTGHVNIPARKGRFGRANQFGSEMERGVGTINIDAENVVLAGHYPDITEEMRAVVDGEIFDIEEVDQASTETMTVLRVQRIT